MVQVSVCSSSYVSACVSEHGLRTTVSVSEGVCECVCVCACVCVCVCV